MPPDGHAERGEERAAPAIPNTAAIPMGRAGDRGSDSDSDSDSDSELDVGQPLAVTCKAFASATAGNRISPPITGT